MPKTLLDPLVAIQTTLPADWDATTDVVKAQVCAGVHEILTGLGCKCNGDKLLVDSIGTTIRERIRGLAIGRRLDSDIKEVAASRGIDVTTASRAEITVAVTADEVNSLVALLSLISQDEISRIVTDAEMAQIETEELAKVRGARDPGWQKDIAQLVARCTPHRIAGYDSTGLWVTETVSVQLATVRAEVDDNGEVCAWMYEEPANA